MNVTLCGVRGSLPTPDADKLGFGGNTSCVLVELEQGRLILDAGSGIRRLGAMVFGAREPVHILLTHLHLDHIMGLLFFAPFFDPEAEVTVWGPHGSLRGLRERLSRYLSAPLSPIEMRELPAKVQFCEVPSTPWEMLGATILATPVTHRGPTLGYRISEDGRSLCYLPDHEPGLGCDLESTPLQWLSGCAVARGADVLIHDAQYTSDEYRGTVGWGHSTIEQTLAYARRMEARRLLLFHHDPSHEDAVLARLQDDARQRFGEQGRDSDDVTMAAEGLTFVV